MGFAWRRKPKTFVVDAVAADAGADLLDDAGKVAAERDGELVLGHLLQRTRRDEDVDRVDRGGAHAHEQLVVADVGRRDVVSLGGLSAEAVEGEGSHRCPFVLGVGLYRIDHSMVERVPRSAGGVLAERLASPGLLLALLGQDAMRRLRAAHTAVGLSPRQFQLLGLLHDRGPMGQRELGEGMGIDPSVLVTMLNPLEESGFVTRQRDVADRRRHIVFLTGAGRKQLTKAARAQREAEDVLFAGLDKDRREQLRQLLLALRASISAGLEAGQEPPSC